MATFIQKMQRRIAQITIGPSVVRGSGTKGVSEPARSLLAALDLRKFAAASESAFGQALDTATEDLRQSVPRGAQSLGLARKCVNLFLREDLYNVYLLNEYGLARAEQWYEIPLDSYVAEGLIKKAASEKPQPHSLPRWRGLKYLEQADSKHYQEYASDRARREGLPARVHLDLDLWRPVAADDGP
jgi:hypothetical protein